MASTSSANSSSSSSQQLTRRASAAAEPASRSIPRGPTLSTAAAGDDWRQPEGRGGQPGGACGRRLPAALEGRAEQRVVKALAKEPAALGWRVEHSLPLLASPTAAADAAPGAGASTSTTAGEPGGAAAAAAEGDAGAAEGGAAAPASWPWSRTRSGSAGGGESLGIMVGPTDPGAARRARGDRNLRRRVASEARGPSRRPTARAS